MAKLQGKAGSLILAYLQERTRETRSPLSSFLNDLAVLILSNFLKQRGSDEVDDDCREHQNVKKLKIKKKEIGPTSV